MPRIYRVMTPDADGKPMIGNAKGKLGVRLGDPPAGDIPVNADGTVHPRTGGMSVAPAWRAFPNFLVPRRLQHLAPKATGKNDADRIYRYGEGAFVSGPVADGLVVTVENPKHGLVEPATIVSLADYEAALRATRDQWSIDED